MKKYDTKWIVCRNAKSNCLAPFFGDHFGFILKKEKSVLRSFSDIDFKDIPP